jgi:hypothetical protein
VTSLSVLGVMSLPGLRHFVNAPARVDQRETGSRRQISFLCEIGGRFATRRSATALVSASLWSPTAWNTLAERLGRPRHQPINSGAKAPRQIVILYAFETATRVMQAGTGLKVPIERNAPLFDECRGWLNTTLACIRVGVELAYRYAPAHRNGLTPVLPGGRTYIDNNAAEREMRPKGLRRERWPP